MSIDITERTCNNCRYYPCLRINCGEKCENHMFEHEKMIQEIDKKLNR